MLTIITVFHKISQFISVSELFIAKIKERTFSLPQDGRGGNQQEIWHFQVISV